jgi:hypothetical protein
MTANVISIIIITHKTPTKQNLNTSTMMSKLLLSMPSQICHTICSRRNKYNKAREQYGNESFILCARLMKLWLHPTSMALSKSTSSYARPAQRVILLIARSFAQGRE